MSQHSIPVDLFNPGQVFACLGFAELAELLVGPAKSAFDWSDPREARFVVEVDSSVDPFAAALEFLSEAEVHSLGVPGADLGTEKWKVDTVAIASGDPFPIPLPESPATLPAVLRARGKSLRLDSWGDGAVPEKLTSRRDNVKFWAGAGGYPGAALLRDALDLARDQIARAREKPFELSCPQSSSFRFDWRRDYIPIDIGFSLNAHGAMQPRGYPLVEVLALVGLSHARPQREHKLSYRYFVCGRDASSGLSIDDVLLPTPLLRASLGTPSLPFPTRAFRMRLDWPGQENQARCITTVDEEIVQ